MMQQLKEVTLDLVHPVEVVIGVGLKLWQLNSIEAIKRDDEHEVLTGHNLIFRMHCIG